MTTSDTEVILRLYAEHGPDASRLNGMFAFLLYDRDQGSLMAARDHFGIKPLYCAPPTPTSCSPPRSRRCCGTPT